MDIHNCYLCNVEIDDSNRSSEHIILNAIGGRLKSDDLLCRDCNSKMGDSADAALAEQFKFMVAHLQVKKERGDIPVIKGGKTKDGTEYHLRDGTTPSLAKPKFQMTKAGEEVRYSITARTEKELKDILTGLSRKYPQLNVEEALKSAKVHSSQLKEPIQYDLEFGGTLAHRSLVKTAVNFYIYNKGERHIVKHLFDMILGKDELDIVKPFYSKAPIYTEQDNEVIHLLHLFGSKQEQVLCCYIELFSSHCFLVILSTEYSGPDIACTYAYDLISGNLLNKEVKFSLTRDEIFAMDTRFSDFAAIAKKYRRVMKIADKKQTQHQIRDIIGKAWDDSPIGKMGEEEEITEQMVEELTKRMVDDVIKLMNGRKIE